MAQTAPVPKSRGPVGWAAGLDATRASDPTCGSAALGPKAAAPYSAPRKISQSSVIHCPQWRLWRSSVVGRIYDAMHARPGTLDEDEARGDGRERDRAEPGRLDCTLTSAFGTMRRMTAVSGVCEWKFWMSRRTWVQMADGPLGALVSGYFCPSQEPTHSLPESRHAPQISTLLSLPCHPLSPYSLLTGFVDPESSLQRPSLAVSRRQISFSPGETMAYSSTF